MGEIDLAKREGGRWRNRLGRWRKGGLRKGYGKGRMKGGEGRVKIETEGRDDKVG